MQNGRGFDTSEKSVRSLYTWKIPYCILCWQSFSHIRHLTYPNTILVHAVTARVLSAKKSTNRDVELEVSAQGRRLHEFCSNPMFVLTNVEISMEYACFIYKRYAKGKLEHAQTWVSDFIAARNWNAEENDMFADCCEFQVHVKLSNYLRRYKIN